MQRNTIGHQNQPDGSPPPGHGGASALHSDPCCRGGARGAPSLLVHRVHQSRAAQFRCHAEPSGRTRGPVGTCYRKLNPSSKWPSLSPRLGHSFARTGPGFDAPQGDPSDPQVNATVGRSRTSRKCKYRCKNGQRARGRGRMRRSLQHLPANSIVREILACAPVTEPAPALALAVWRMQSALSDSFRHVRTQRCCGRPEPTRALIPERIVRTGTAWNRRFTNRPEYQ